MEYVENTVQPQEQNVMSCDILYIFQLIYHEKLGQNSKCLQPDAETPGEVKWVQGFMDDDSHEHCSSVNIIMRQRIRIPIVAQTEWLSDFHEIHCISSYCDKQDLHHEDIEGSPP